MKKNNLFISFTVLLFLIVNLSILRAQDPTFTQFYSNPMYLNPALAGSTGCPRFSLNYRNEWPSLSGNYVTYSAAYDYFAKNLNGGLGILALHDRQGQGTIQTSMIGGFYSYHLKVDRKFTIMAGVRAAYFQKSLDWSQLTFGDMIDPRRGFIYQTGDVPRGGNKSFFDASAGLVGFGKNYYFGLAAHHLTRPNESMILGDSRLPIRWTGHAGTTINIGKRGSFSNKTSISPNIIYQYQNGFQELNIGTYVKHDVFTGGIWYRNNDAFIILVGIATDKFKIGYSYDLTVSKLGNAITNGSHEISMGIFLKCRKPKQIRRINCPSF